MIFTSWAIIKIKSVKNNTDLEEFIEESNEELLNDYSKTLLENLKNLNDKEEKHNQWILIMVVLFFILSNSSIDSFNIGPININDISVLGKILPLVFTFNLFYLRTISNQKKEISNALKTLCQYRFNLDKASNIEEILGLKSITRLYLPFSFTNSILKLYNKKPSITESIIGFTLLIPLIIIAFAPYVIIFMMLVNLHKNYMNDFFGTASFYLTIWLVLIMLFYIIKDSRDKN